MIGRILKIELLSIFLLTIANVVVFYAGSSLPDNLISISSAQEEISYFSYYLTSGVVTASYFTGLWIVIPFLVFSILYAFLFSKRDRIWDVFNLLFLLTFFMLFAYWLPTSFVGEGHTVLLEKLFAPYQIVLLLISTVALFVLGCGIDTFVRAKMVVISNAKSGYAVLRDPRSYFLSKWNLLKGVSLQNMRLFFARKIKFKMSTKLEATTKATISEDDKTVQSGGPEKNLEMTTPSAIEISTVKVQVLKEALAKENQQKEIVEKIQKEMSKKKKQEPLNQSMNTEDSQFALVPRKSVVTVNREEERDDIVEQNIYADQDEQEYDLVRQELIECIRPLVKPLKDESVGAEEEVIDPEEMAEYGLENIDEEEDGDGDPDDIVQEDVIDTIDEELDTDIDADAELERGEEELLQDPVGDYFSKVVNCLEEKFKEFKIDAKIVNIIKGPVVDTFELELGAGVRISKVTAITEDLALALHGVPIRMIYPMKGKSTIGIEIPHSSRRVVYLDEVVSSPSFTGTDYKLPLLLGINTFGEVFIVDLASMPHMLIAGATGSGKSVFINTILTSLLVKKSPQKMKLILIDPKQLELALYATLPHLILPVISGAKQASFALIWAIQEMERRYLILRELGVRNVEGFNQKIRHASRETIAKIDKYYPDSFANLIDTSPFELPYIVIIIDEFADLILGPKGKEIELSVCRLAAKARASGIHLIMATQRPSVDVITGLIKSNFPTRISFRVSSGIDSRTILNSLGAEKLLGHGDMLYRNGVEVERLHSAYISEREIGLLVDKLTESGLLPTYDRLAVEYLDSLDKTKMNSDFDYDGLAQWVDENREGERESGSSSSSTGHHGDEELFREALRIISDEKQVSVSMLQRRLRIGFNRAATLVEQLEEKGIIGPSLGSKPREVFIDKIEFHL
ncbi:MAG: DUF87 domain-containing protein [Oligoflexia bacterium]|nr:DUF87 domain-containing protein [Oligoflexia bacterium]